MAYLTGSDEQITTIDIDPEVTAQARQALDATGYEHVQVITRDGSLGDPEHAPYDRIIFTIGAWDIPRAVQDQLAPGGHLAVPLRWRGTTRCLALVKDKDGSLRADAMELCGFVPMLGADQDGERSGRIDTEELVTLYWDADQDADQDVDPDLLHGVLGRAKTATWSGAVVGPMEPFDGVWLRLTGTEPGTCRIAAEPAAVSSGLCTPAIPVRSPALVEQGSLAYFALKLLGGDGDERRWELGRLATARPGRTSPTACASTSAPGMGTVKRFPPSPSTRRAPPTSRSARGRSSSPSAARGWRCPGNPMLWPGPPVTGAEPQPR